MTRHPSFDETRRDASSDALRLPQPPGAGALSRRLLPPAPLAACGASLRLPCRLPLPLSGRMALCRHARLCAGTHAERTTRGAAGGDR